MPEREKNESQREFRLHAPYTVQIDRWTSYRITGYVVLPEREPPEPDATINYQED